MIILKSLQLHNFLSHPKTEIKFNDKIHCLIDGKSGSGKSSLIDAITWGLYGHARSDNRSLIKRGSKMASVIIELKDDKNEYKIERTITNRGKHDLIITENNKPIKAIGLRGHQEYLEKNIIHSSYLLFINSVLHLQEDIESFVKQPATKKKEIILEIINANIYDEYYEKTREFIKKIEAENIQIDFIISEKQNNINTNKEIANNLKQNQDELFKIENELKQIEEKIENNVKQQNEYEKIKNDVVNKKQQKELLVNIDSDICYKMRNISHKIEELKSININELKKSINILEIKRQELIKLEKDVEIAHGWNEKMMQIINNAPIDHNYQSIIDDINSQIMALMTKKVDICPELSKECPVLVKGRDEQIKALEVALNGKKQALREYAEKKMVNDMEKDALGEKPQINPVLINNIRIDIRDLEIKEKEYYQLKNKEELIVVYNKELEELYNQKIENEIKIKSIMDEINKLNGGLIDGEKIYQELLLLKNNKYGIEQKKQNAMLSVKESERALDNIKKLENELNDLNKQKKDIIENIENLKLLKDAFSPNGIKAVLIDYTIPRLEDRINFILSKLSDFRVRLDTQKDAVNSDNVIEGLWINIFNEFGESFDYSNYSGGEKVKVSVAISEALAEISNINFRILDESIVALDDESIQQFLEAMSIIQQKVGQILCISHINAIKDIFTEKIIVTKINGNSIVNSF